MKQSMKKLKIDLKYIIKLVWEYDKSLFIFFILFSVFGAFLDYVELYVPKILLGSLIQDIGIDRLILRICFLGLAILTFTFAKSWTGNVYERKCGLVRTDLCLSLLTLKRFRIRYHYTEDPAAADLFERAKYISWSSNMGIEATLNNLRGFISGLILLIGVSAICAVLNPIIPFILIAVAAVKLLIGNSAKKKVVQLLEENASFDRELDYLSKNMGEPDMGKDIRVYRMKNWLLEKYTACLQRRINNEEKTEKTLTSMRQKSTWLEMLANIAVYAFLIADVLSGRTGVDDFLLYLGAAATLSSAFQAMTDSATNIFQYSKCISDFREVMELKEEFDETDDVQTEGLSERKAATIRFDRVSYHYPGNDKTVLRDLSFEIREGERIALIGVNGAGKTTIAKLMIGLLEPDSGKIYINGTDVRQIPRRQLRAMFSAVFQEINQYAFTISQNIAFGEEYEEERIQYALEHSRLGDVVKKLPKGIGTMLRKDYAADGVLLSGGEAQSLALARALYKDSPFLVLDEPTAALDALAENRLYQRFDEMMQGKTVLFISHRLASTLFCDRVLLINDGKIYEEGTHDELLRRGGLYAQMYKSQSERFTERGKDV